MLLVSSSLSPTQNSPERRLLDERVREFQVVREIGRGGMGVVFLARDIRLHRLVAIKVLRNELAMNPDQRERFRREARVTAQLSDDGIVAVHDYGELDDLVFIVMEYVHGQALGTRIAGGPLDPREARAILAALAMTLDHAHCRGIVHRDLKPENILIDASGRPRLTDFGVAFSRSLDPLPSEFARAFGTPHFMSPEQAAGETDLDGRSDIYSLGVLGYLLLTGNVPFDGDSFATIAARHIAEQHAPLLELAPRTPRDIAAVIEKCLMKERAARWRHARDIAPALTRSQNRLFGLNAVTIAAKIAALIPATLGLPAAK